MKIASICVAVTIIGIVLFIRAIYAVRTFMDDSFRWGNKDNSRKDDIL